MKIEKNTNLVRIKTAILVSFVVIMSAVKANAYYIHSGTIIVIAQTKDRVIIAADSRRGATMDGIDVESVEDSGCKIAAFSRNVVFSAAGILGVRGQEWTAMSLAEDVIKSFLAKPIRSMEGEVILSKWADAIIQRLSVFSSGQLLSYGNLNEGHVATAVLAGIENDKETWVRAVMVNFSSEKTGLSHKVYNADI